MFPATGRTLRVHRESLTHVHCQVAVPHLARIACICAFDLEQFVQELGDLDGTLR